MQLTNGTSWCSLHGWEPCACRSAAVASWSINGQEIDTQTTATFVTPEHLCPDLLRYAQIGPADTLRGRVVRLFFSCLRVWPVKG